MSAYRRADRIAARTIDGVAFVISVDHHRMLELNEVGTFIWGALQGEPTLDELTAAVVEEFDVPEDVARRDAEDFLRVLVDRSVVLQVERHAP